jgi:hypothetical protein
VVRRMFELCAAGAGLTRITKTLNAEGMLALRPQLGRPHAWASSVRAVLADHSTRARSRGTNRESAIVGASSTSTRGPRSSGCGRRRRYSELYRRSCGRGRTHSSKGGRRSSPAAERIASPVICCQASPGARSAAADSPRSRGRTGSSWLSSTPVRRTGSVGGRSAATAWRAGWT